MQPDWVEQPALLVVDMQNDFVRGGAPLEVPDARNTIGPHRELLGLFERRGWPVVYTRFLSRSEPNLLWTWSPQCWPPTKCCWRGHRRFYRDIGQELECTDVIDELRPKAQDVIIDKYGYGAFHGTPLADFLHSAMIRSVIVTGTVTQICVEESGRQAFHHGFRTTLVADAVSSFAPDLHAATLKNFAMKFGWVVESSELLSYFS
jgi:nicotinamidase-related amidase